MSVESDLIYYAVGKAGLEIAEYRDPNMKRDIANRNQNSLAVAAGFNMQPDSSVIDFEVVKIVPLPLDPEFIYLHVAEEIECEFDLPLPKSTRTVSKFKWTNGEHLRTWFGLLFTVDQSANVDGQHGFGGDMYWLEGKDSITDNYWTAVASEVKNQITDEPTEETEVDIPLNAPGGRSRWLSFEVGHWYLQGWSMTRKNQSMVKDFKETFNLTKQNADWIPNEWIPNEWIKKQASYVKTNQGFDPIIIECSSFNLPKFVDLFGIEAYELSRVHDPIEATSENFKERHIAVAFGMENLFDWESLWFDVGIHIAVAAFGPRFYEKSEKVKGSITLMQSRKRGTGILRIDGTIRQPANGRKANSIRSKKAHQPDRTP